MGLSEHLVILTLRERLDTIDPGRRLRKLFTKVFSLLQRGKGLEGFTYLDNHY